MEWGRSQGSCVEKALSLAAKLGIAMALLCFSSSLSKAFADAAWDKLQRDAGFPDAVNPKSVTQLEVKCRDSGPIIMGERPCQDTAEAKGFMNAVEQATRSSLSAQIADYYRGTSTNFLTGGNALTAVPVCNLSQGEVDKNWLPASEGNSCGQYCGMSVDTGPLGLVFSVKTDDKNGHCDREYGWYRGAFVQVLSFYKEKIFNEFKSKRIELTDVEGSRPCASVAADVMRVQAAAADTTKSAVSYLGSADKAAAQKCKQLDQPQRKIASAGTVFDNDPASVAACSLTRANMNVISLWSKFLGCEIRWRAAKDFEEKFGDQEKWISDAKASIKTKCESYVNCTPCKDSTRTKLLNECYRKNAPTFLRDRLRPYDAPMDLPGRTTSNSTDTGVGSLMLVAGLINARKRRPRKQGLSRMLAAMLFLVSFWIGGCSCHPDNVTCTPCAAPESQQKGCVYKACLEGVYMCFKSGKIAQGDINYDSLSNTRDKDFDSHNSDGSSSSAKTTCITLSDIQSGQDMANWVARRQGLMPSIQEKMNQSQLTFQDGHEAALTSQWQDWAATQQPPLKAVSLEDARNTCRQIAGLSDGSSNYDDPASSLGQDQGIGNGVAAKGKGQGDKTTANEYAAIRAAIDNWNSSQPSASDNSCISNMNGTNSPEAGAAFDVHDAAQSLSDARSLFGGTQGPDKGTAAPSNDPQAANSATAQDRSSPQSGGGLGPSGGSVGSPNGLSLNLPNQNPTPQNNGNLGGSSQGLSAPSSSGANSGNEANRGLAADAAPGTINKEGVGWEAAAQGGGGKKNSDNPFASLFGGGAQGPMGSGGASNAAFGLLPGTQGDIELYLSKNAKSSLFEIVNKRADKLSSEINGALKRLPP